MKKIEAYIKPFKLYEVKKALTDAQVNVFRILDTQELSSQQTYMDVYRGTEYEVDNSPRTMLIIYAADNRVDAIVACIQEACQTEHRGDGRIAVTPVERMILIDTAELEPQ